MPGSSPKNALKPSPILHPFLFLPNIVKHYFSKKIINKLPENESNNIYLADKLKAVALNEKNTGVLPKKHLQIHARLDLRNGNGLTYWGKL